LVFLGGVAQRVEHNTGLHAGVTLLRVQLEERVHVFGKIEHDSDIAALPGQAGAAAAREDRRVELATRADRGDDVLFILWNNQADWNLPVV
jgi:hypothetical protein